MSIKVILEIGHEASLKHKPTPDGFTHDWELYVRGCDGNDISHFIDKVVFNLHESFPKPKRVIKEPPYLLKESGYAGFVLPIDIYLKNRDEPKKITFNYDLVLFETPIPFKNAQRETFTIAQPSDDFRRKLLKGGGVMISSSGNSLDEKHKDFNDERTQLISKPKLGGTSSDKKGKHRGEDSKTSSTFANLFGTPLANNKTVSKVSPDAKSSKASPNMINSMQIKPPSSKSQDKSSSKDSSGGGGRGEKNEKGGGDKVDKDREKSSKHNKHSSPYKDKSDVTASRGGKNEEKNAEGKQRDEGGGGGGGSGSTSSSSKSKKDKSHTKERERSREKNSSKQKTAPFPPPPSSPKIRSPKRMQSSPVRNSSASVLSTPEILSQKNSTGSSSKSAGGSNADVPPTTSATKKSKKEKKEKNHERERDRNEKRSSGSGSGTTGVAEKDKGKFSLDKFEIKSTTSGKDKEGGHTVTNSSSTSHKETLSTKYDKNHVLPQTHIRDQSPHVQPTTSISSSSSVAAVAPPSGKPEKNEERKHKHKKKDKSKKDENYKEKDRKKDKDRSERSSSSKSVVSTSSASTINILSTKDHQEAKSQKERGGGSSRGNDDIPSKLSSSSNALNTLMNEISEKDSSDSEVERSSVSSHHPNDRGVDIPDRNNHDNHLSAASSSGSNVTASQQQSSVVAATTAAAAAAVPTTSSSSKSNKKSKEKSSKKEKESVAASAAETKEERKRKRKLSQAARTSTPISTAMDPPPSKSLKRDDSQSVYKNGETSNKIPTIVNNSTDDGNSASGIGGGERSMNNHDYMAELRDLQHKIMTLEDSNGLQQVVEMIAATGRYEITSKSFDFDLCAIDRSTVKRLQEFFAVLS